MSTFDAVTGLVVGGAAGFWVAYAKLSFKAFPWIAKQVDRLREWEARLLERQKEVSKGEGRAMEAEFDAQWKQREIDRLQAELDDLRSAEGQERLEWLAGQLSAHLSAVGTAHMVTRNTAKVDAERAL